MKKIRVNKNKPKEAKHISPKPTVQEKEDTFDFGGIPKRDLKKNLGCG